MSAESVSLSQLVSDVKITLQHRYDLPVWVIAEISELNINRSGHCYLELVEKDALSDRIIAKCRATIWSFTYRTIKAYFESITSETLRAGLKVLLKASVEFHEIYGFSLNIQDIDPKYTLGDMARKKAQIIQQLNDDGVLEMNKSLTLSLIPQCIAVISSETAAGYGDFSDQLSKNSQGFKFHTELFPAIMQGDKASESIIMAMESIFGRIDEFDAVAILRGGGSKSDLSCFDDYELAYFITQFPLPVITGIGHERDESIADMVAHTRLKTPTAIAEFLIEKAATFNQSLEYYLIHVSDLVEEWFEKSEYLLEKFSHRLQKGSVELLQINQEFLMGARLKVISGVKQIQVSEARLLNNQKQRFQMLAKASYSQEMKLCEIRRQRLNRWIQNYFRRKERKLQFLEEKTSLVNPQHILDRGFAWVTHQNKLIKYSKDLQKGDAITIKLKDGIVEGQVIKTRKN